MRTRDTENKRLSAEGIETKTEQPDDAVLVCPERDRHAKMLNQVCAGCGERIPGHGMYTPAEFERYFAPPTVETAQYLSPEEQAYREDNRLRWEEYAALDAQRVALLFALDAAKQNRYAIRGSSRWVDRGGNVQTDDSAPVRGAAANASVAEIEERLRTAERVEAEHMRETVKRDTIHAGRRRNAILAESFPPPPSRGLLERAGAALRGQSP